MSRLWLAAALLPISGSTVFAQERPTPTCQAEVAPPVEFAAWSAAKTVVSAKAARGLITASFAAGNAVDLSLHPDGEVTYLTLPKGAGEKASFGGLAGVHVTRAGLYKIGIGGFAWVDMTHDGKPTAPVSFGHGPDCTAIKKVVGFQLVPGDYTLEISGNPSARLRVIVVRA